MDSQSKSKSSSPKWITTKGEAVEGDFSPKVLRDFHVVNNPDVDAIRKSMSTVVKRCSEFFNLSKCVGCGRDTEIFPIIVGDHFWVVGLESGQTIHAPDKGFCVAFRTHPCSGNQKLPSYPLPRAASSKIKRRKARWASIKGMRKQIETGSQT